MATPAAHPVLRRALVFAAICGALALYFHRTFDLGFFGLDELNVFAAFERATDAELLLREIFKPHNRHFAPVFKALFYLEYRLFGPSPVPYHWASVVIFALSAALLWVWVRGEVGGRFPALVCATLYAANATYFTVIIWVFLQQLMLTVIFIELSFLYVQRAKGPWGFVLAGVFSMFSSFCLSLGAASWFFTAVYYGARLWSAPPEGRPGPKGVALRLLPLLASALITAVAYYMARGHFPENTLRLLVLSPARLIDGAVVIMGNSLVKTAGLFNLINLWVPMHVLMPAFEFLLVASAILWAAASLLLLKKLPARGRAAALTGLVLFPVTSAAVTSASLGYFDIDAMELVNFDRYHYFPIFFMLVGLAPYLTLLGGRGRRRVLIALPLWVAVHYIIFLNLILLNLDRVQTIQSTLKFVQEAAGADFPIVRGEEGIKMVYAPMKTARPLEDIAFFRQERPSYKDLLRIYNKPGDMVVEYREMFLVLKNTLPVPMERMRASPGVETRQGRRTLGFSSKDNVSVRAGVENTPGRAPYMHLVFRLRSSGKTAGRLLCTSATGARKETEFDVDATWVHRLYALPCPSASEIVLLLGPGEYSIRDMSLRY